MSTFLRPGAACMTTTGTMARRVRVDSAGELHGGPCSEQQRKGAAPLPCVGLGEVNSKEHQQLRQRALVRADSAGSATGAADDAAGPDKPSPSSTLSPPR